MPEQRVVVTGMGVLSALGHNLKDFCSAIFSGQSGIRIIDDPDFQELPVRYAARVNGFSKEILDYDQKMLHHMDLFSVYGLCAGMQAVEHSKILQHRFDPSRFGVCLGSGIGGLLTLETQKARLDKRGSRGVSPFFIPSLLANMAAAHLAMRYGLTGPSTTPSTACCSSAHAIIQGYDWIKHGQADAVLTGGCESACTPLGIAGFSSARALSSRFHECPDKASRPFDMARDGFVMGDGGAALMLESYEHAQARGAPILAEIIGTGSSSDAYHLTSPHPEGRGAILAIEKALSQAGLLPEELGAINLHATSTPRGDEAELVTLRHVFGDHLPHIPLSATKSMTGHLLGGAGALEAIISVLSLQQQKLPPSCHIEKRDPCSDGVNLVVNKALPYVFETILSNSFGFGGINATLIFAALSSKKV